MPLFKHKATNPIATGVPTVPPSRYVGTIGPWDFNQITSHSSIPQQAYALALWDQRGNLQAINRFVDPVQLHRELLGHWPSATIIYSQPDQCFVVVIPAETSAAFTLHGLMMRLYSQLADWYLE